MRNRKMAAGGEPNTSLWTHDFILLLFTSFFNLFCMQILTASMALWVDSLGLAAGYTGVFTVCFSLPNVIGCAVWGCFSPKLGRRKLILLGCAVFGLASLALALTGALLWAIALLRILQGIGYSAVNNGLSSTQADVVAPQRLGEGIGYFSTAQCLSMVIGPSLAILVSGRVGFQPIFLCITVLCLAISVCCLRLRTDIGPSAVQRSQAEMPHGADPARGVWRFVEKRAMFPAGVMLFSMLSLCSVNIYVSTFAADRGFSNASLFFALYAFVEMLAIAAVSKFSDRLPMHRLAVPGMLLAAAGLLGLGLVRSAGAFLLLALPVGIGSAFIVPVTQAECFRGVPMHRRGMAAATFFIAFDGGMGLGSLIWGAVIERGGYTAMYMGAAAFLAVAAALTLGASLRRRRKECDPDAA